MMDLIDIIMVISGVFLNKKLTNPTFYKYYKRVPSIDAPIDGRYTFKGLAYL